MVAATHIVETFYWRSKFPTVRRLPAGSAGAIRLMREQMPTCYLDHGSSAVGVWPWPEL
jgi:hypothetical protein